MGDAKLLVKLILVEFRQMYIKYCRLVFKISCFNDGEPALSLSTLFSFFGASQNSTQGKGAI